MKREKLWWIALLLAVIVFAAGCQPFAQSQPVRTEALEIYETPAPAATPAPTPSIPATPEPTPEITPTPEPVPVYATIGAVGDVMVMQSQVSGAWNKALQDYDFRPSFTKMQPLFESVDLMCANLETPLAGEEAGYSGPAPAAVPAAEAAQGAEGEAPAATVRPRQTFNAPDALARGLKASGVDVLTTANNHCLDRGAAGLVRTMETLDALEIMRAGTYLSEEDRATARVAVVNGIRVGIIAHTFSVNRNESMIPSDQRAYFVARLNDKTAILEDIALCRQAGAEFIIAFEHWDEEFMDAPTSSTRKTAKWLFENGVDAIIGSHPHVVQPIEYMTVEREDGPYTGLVAYSMANFISNMSPAPKNYGLFVQLTLEKDVDGSVRLYDAAYLPLLCVRGKVDGRTLHQVLPAYQDTSLVTDQASVEKQLNAAREHVTRVCGEQVRTLEDGG